MKQREKQGKQIRKTRKCLQYQRITSNAGFKTEGKRTYFLNSCVCVLSIKREGRT